MIIEFGIAERPSAHTGRPLLRRSTLGGILALRSGRVGLVLLALILGIAVLAPWLAPLDPLALTGGPLSPPSRAHLMGTDALGRDLFSGIVWGARASLLIAIGVSLLTFACGMFVGLVGGYFGGLADDILTRLTELLQVLPRFLLVILAVAILGPGVDRLILTLGLTSWAALSRVVRADVLALGHTDFVIAARASGASHSRILRRNLLPNVMPTAIVLMGLLVGQVLLLEASLGFLGLGDPSVVSWGLMASRAHEFARVAWWLPLFPGLAISSAVLAANLLADAYTAVIKRS